MADQTTSVNRADFKAYGKEAERRQSFKPKQVREEVKEDRDFQSAASSTYVKHTVARPQKTVKRAQDESVQQSARKFEAVSTSQADFPKYDRVERVKPIKSDKKDQVLLSEAKSGDYHFEYQTETQAKFAVAAAPRPKGAAQEQPKQTSPSTKNSRNKLLASSALGDPNAKFEATSVTRSDFAYRPQKPAEPVKPRPGAFATQLNNDEQKDDRDFQTVAAQAFVFRGKAEREARAPRNKQLDSAQAAAIISGGKFTAVSTTQADFKQMSGAAPAKPFRPKQVVEHTEEDRDWKTEARAQYERASAAPAASSSAQQESDPTKMTAAGTRSGVRAQQSQLQFGGKFEGESVSHANFTAHSGARPAQAYRPPVGQNNIATTDAKNEEAYQSESRAQFQQKGMEKRKSFAPTAAVYQSQPFTAVSASHSDYAKPEHVERTQAIKPPADHDVFSNPPREEDAEEVIVS